jgi:hypothetical protein
MSKAFIVGDLHFGVRANSQEYLKFQVDWFRNELFPNIEKHGVDHVIFLGDVNDSRISLSPLIMKRERDLFIELKNKFPEVDFHVILGNHDLYYKSTREVHSLDFMSDIGYNVYEDPTELVVDDRNLLFLPWILKDELNDIQLRLAENKYDCVFGHLEIQGFPMMRGILDKDGLEKSIFDNCGKVFSGHYHLRSKKGKIQYVGTPYQISRSDEGDQKGIELIDFDTMKSKHIKSKHIPLHLSFSSSLQPFDSLNKTLVTNNMLKITLGKELSEVQKIEYVEKINSLRPFSVVFEDEEDASLVVNDKEIQNSLKDTLSFLDEYCGIVNVEDDDVDISEIREKFREYFNKAHL